jgi:hypothetical protein
MTEAQHPHRNSSEEPALDHELRVGSIVWLTTGLLLIIGIAALAMWFFGFGVRDRLVAEDPPPPVLPEARMPYRPPPPRLQVDPRQQLLDLRAEEAQVLATYGWVDETRGLARVPIDRAMDLLVEQGLPSPMTAPTPSAPAATGN